MGMVSVPAQSSSSKASFQRETMQQSPTFLALETWVGRTGSGALAWKRLGGDQEAEVRELQSGLRVGS